MVSRLDPSHVRPHLFDNAGTLMAQHGWRRREGERAIHVRQIAMADTTGCNFDQYFSPIESINLDLLDYQGRIVFVKDGGLPGPVLPVFLATQEWQKSKPKNLNIE